MRISLLGLLAVLSLALGCSVDRPRCSDDRQCPAGDQCDLETGRCVLAQGPPPDGGDRDPLDAGPFDAGLDVGDAGDAGPVDNGRPEDAGPGEPFDSGPSDPPVNNGRDAG